MTSLPRTLVNRLLTVAQSSNEREVCGLIGSIDGQAHSFYAVENVAGDPVHRFEMEPRQQIDAMRQMRDQGEEIFAIFHSHPDATATPSVTDIEQAAYPDCLYLIVSLNTKGVLEMRGFHIRNGIAKEVELEVA